MQYKNLTPACGGTTEAENLIQMQMAINRHRAIRNIQPKPKGKIRYKRPTDREGNPIHNRNKYEYEKQMKDSQKEATLERFASV